MGAGTAVGADSLSGRQGMFIARVCRSVQQPDVNARKREDCAIADAIIAPIARINKFVISLFVLFVYACFYK